MEMRSGPAAAIARTFFKVIPPDTSTSARPLISRMAWRTDAGFMLSSRMMSARPATACRTSANDSASTIIFMLRGALAFALRQAVRTGIAVWFRRAR